MRTALLIAAAAALVGSAGCRAAEAVASAVSAAPESLRQTGPLRGVWVTRWDYRTPEDVREVMRNASQMGLTDVFWQVRGQADAYYESDLEPWGEALFRDSPSDSTPPSRVEASRGPGFDPLALAVREAHRRGLRLHAWMNVMPLWKGTTEPVDPDHPLLARRAWRLKDSAGTPQPLNEHYVIVNPVLETVQDHIVAVARDIVRRYEVDGLHLDYVRFVGESLDEGAVYPGDAVSLAMFREAKGLDPAAEVKPEALRGWVRERITDLVTRIRREAVDTRVGVAMTAAVWRRPELAREEQLQEAAAWVNAGLLDAVMPMMYTADDARYRRDLSAWARAAPRPGAVAPGVGVYLHESGRQTVGQVGMHADKDRFVLFAYSSLFRSAAADSLDTPQAESERLRRRVPLRAIMQD